MLRLVRFAAALAAVALPIQAQSVTVAVASSANPSVYAAPVTFSVSVNAPAGSPVPAGSVSAALRGSYQLGTAALDSAGHAVISVPRLPGLLPGMARGLSAGANAITFSYSGDSRYAASDAAFTQWIGKAASLTTATLSGGTASVAVSIDERATSGEPFDLAGGSNAPTGTVRFLDGVRVLGTVTLAESSLLRSTAALAVPTPPANLIAEYSGDANFDGSRSQVAAPVGTASASVSVLSSANPSTFADTVTLKIAVVTPFAGKVPSGSVTAAIQGLFQLGSANLDANGTAAIVVPSTSGLFPKIPWGFAAGSNDVTVSYSGDATFAAAETKFTQKVNPANTTITATILPTASLGTSIQATVSIKSSNATTLPFTLPGNAAVTYPSGTIQFMQAGAVIGTVALGPSGILESSAILTIFGNIGTGDIIAAYKGDANYNGSTSPPAGPPNKTAANVLVKSSANPAIFAQPVTFAAFVAPAVSGGPVPTGTVQAKVLGTYVLGSGTLDSSGIVTFTVPQDPGMLAFVPWGLAAGSNLITLSYSGDTRYAPSQATYNQLVNKANTSTTLILPPVAIGATFFKATATVRIDEKDVSKIGFGIPGAGNTGTSPTGNIAFFNGATLLGTVALDPGSNYQSTASITTAFVPQSIRAVYYGDSNYNGSSSPGDTGGGAPAIVSVASSANTVAYGAAFTIVGTVTPATDGSVMPTGTLTFYDGAQDMGRTATLDSSGRGNLPIPLPLPAPLVCPCPSAAPVMVLSAGTHTITVTYSGDANYAPSKSTAPLILKVTKATTTTALEYASTGVFPSLSLHIVADVADGQPPKGGPYRFLLRENSGMVDGNPSGTVLFYGDSTILGKGILTPNKIVDVTSNASFDTISQNVTYAAVYSGDANFEGSTSAPPTRKPTFIKMESSPNPSAMGQVVTLTASMSPAPTGSVDFLDGTTLLGRVALSTTGIATLQVSFAAAGTHSLTASYTGDANYLPSASIAVAHTVQTGSGQTGVLTLTASPATAVYGQKITFAIGVTGTASTPPTGTVSLLDGSTVVAAGPVSSNIILLVTSLSVGPHQISAVWPGDANWPAAKSPLLAVTVKRALTLTTVKQSGSGYVAIVTAVAPGAGIPTGTVQFIDAKSNNVYATATLQNGSAQITLNTFAAVTIGGIYSGDANFEPSTSKSLPVVASSNGTAFISTFAPEEIATIYGDNLAASVAIGAPPLTTSLGNSSVTVTDSKGVSRPALLYYVSPAQINFVIPAGTASGEATVTVAGSDIPMMMTAVAPSLFPAAQIVRVHPDGSQTIETVAGPVAFGSDSLYLVLYASGVRNRSSLDNVRCLAGTTSLAVTYAGPQAQFPGLDQIVVPLPASMKGAGSLNVMVTADGQSSNALAIVFQ